MVEIKALQDVGHFGLAVQIDPDLESMQHT